MKISEFIYRCNLCIFVSCQATRRFVCYSKILFGKCYSYHVMLLVCDFVYIYSNSKEIYFRNILFPFFSITKAIICHLWENLLQVKKAGCKIYKEGVKDPEDNAGWFSWLWTWSEPNAKQLEVKPGSMFISFYIR